MSYDESSLASKLILTGFSAWSLSENWSEFDGCDTEEKPTALLAKEKPEDNGVWKQVLGVLSILFMKASLC